MATSELEKRPAHTVDQLDEPSVEWGWHGHFPRMKRIAAWVSAAVLLLMTFGNHQGHVEDLWLIGIAAVIVFALLRDIVKSRTSWRA